MIELSVIRDLVAIFGVIAGFSYYVMTVRNAERARKMQLMMEVRRSQKDEEFQKGVVKLMQVEWEDYDDFINKYSSAVNPDHYATRYKLWVIFDELGYLVKKGFIDLESVFEMYQGIGPLGHWQLWEPIIVEQRKRMGLPNWFQWFEYLANEIKVMRVKRGYPSYQGL